jgi:hypothetical protein
MITRELTQNYNWEYLCSSSNLDDKFNYLRDTVIHIFKIIFTFKCRKYVVWRDFLSFQQILWNRVHCEELRVQHLDKKFLVFYVS